jgi:hypothetical protein
VAWFQAIEMLEWRKTNDTAGERAGDLIKGSAEIAMFFV